jgi:hypothetical protein
MGLMDKVKAQATQIAQQTREAAQEGKAKIDAAQANRRGDQMLRQLGAAVFADRTGRGTPDSQARIDQLITDISAYERENGLNLAADPAQQNVPPQPGFPPDPASPFPGPAASTFPGAGQSSFPDPGTTSFPDQGTTGFPDAGPAGFPETSAPDPGTAPPESGGFGGIPPES